MQQGDGVQFLFTEFSPYIMHRFRNCDVVIIFVLSSAVLTPIPQYTRHEQPGDSHVHLVIRYESAPHYRTRFSFLSALGYSLSVLDEEDGSMRPFSANDAAAFNNKSR
jgi:hypothetical protein